VPPAGCPLPPRELAVLRLLARGLRRRQVAEELGISVSCVSYRLAAAASRLRVSTTAQLVGICTQAGWIDCEERRPTPQAVDQQPPGSPRRFEPPGSPRRFDPPGPRGSAEREGEPASLLAALPASEVAVPYGCPLSPAQFETLRLLGEGLTYKEIARRRRCSISTVRSHVNLIREKLNVPKCAQAVLLAYRKGWLDDHAESQVSIQVRRLANATEELVMHLQRPRNRIDPALRHYLAAFDELILARGEPERRAARARMESSLDRVLGDRRIPARPAPTHTAAFARLLDALIAQTRTAA